MTNMTRVINDLIYVAYRYNREKTPDVEPERWSAVFFDYDVPALEERYQRERSQATITCSRCGGPSSRNDEKFWSCDGAYPHLCDGTRRAAEAGTI